MKLVDEHKACLHLYFLFLTRGEGMGVEAVDMAPV